MNVHSLSYPEALAATQPLEPRQLRDAYGRFATGVAVVTTLDPERRPVGMTISSFNTVSIDPPLILWSIELNAPSLCSFRATQFFAINVLSAAQHDLCYKFSRPAADKFEGVAWRAGDAGVPLLDGALAHLQCRVHARHPGGDHEIYLGQVQQIATQSGVPLIFYHGKLTPLA